MPAPLACPPHPPETPSRPFCHSDVADLAASLEREVQDLTDVLGWVVTITDRLRSRVDRLDAIARTFLSPAGQAQ